MHSQLVHIALANKVQRSTDTQLTDKHEGENAAIVTIKLTGMCHVLALTRLAFDNAAATLL